MAMAETGELDPRQGPTSEAAADKLELLQAVGLRLQVITLYKQAARSLHEFAVAGHSGADRFMKTITENQAVGQLVKEWLPAPLRLSMDFIPSFRNTVLGHGAPPQEEPAEAGDF